MVTVSGVTARLMPAWIRPVTVGSDDDEDWVAGFAGGGTTRTAGGGVAAGATPGLASERYAH